MVRETLPGFSKVGPRVAWMAIVKAGDDSEAVQLARMLSSINGYVDAIYLQLNAPEGTKVHPRIRQIAEQFTDHIQEHVWTGNFVTAQIGRASCRERV